ncbi:hypothetical protein ACSOSP_34135 [Caballeronia sp. KNU42]
MPVRLRWPLFVPDPKNLGGERRSSDFSHQALFAQTQRIERGSILGELFGDVGVVHNGEQLAFVDRLPLAYEQLFDLAAVRMLNHDVMALYTDDTRAADQNIELERRRPQGEHRDCKESCACDAAR